MDSGNHLSQCQRGPWLSANPLTKETRLHPIFQHRSRMALSPPPSETHHPTRAASPGGGGPDRDPQSSQPQSIDHLHANYGRYLKTEIMAHDAFYALHELFEYSAASIDQLLELIQDTNFGVVLPHNQADATKLSELLILNAFLDDYRSYVKDTLEVVRARGSPRWPRVTEPRLREKADRAARQLETRYQRLLAKCVRLLEQSSSAITILMNLQSQRQADKAMEQTDKLGKLSVLAYFYIPITFAASFYGMNFAELGDYLSIWTYFAMAAPLLVVSLIAWFIDVLSVCQRCWLFVKGLFSRKNSSVF